VRVPVEPPLAYVAPPPPPPPPDEVGMRVKVAETEVAPDMVVVQEPVPEHAPDQPEKVYPEDGVAVRVIPVPEVTEAEQVEPQEMPLPDMVP
jgi:hypothetical protein